MDYWRTVLPTFVGLLPNIGRFLPTIWMDVSAGQGAVVIYGELLPTERTPRRDLPRSPLPGRIRLTKPPLPRDVSSPIWGVVWGVGGSPFGRCSLKRKKRLTSGFASAKRSAVVRYKSLFAFWRRKARFTAKGTQVALRLPIARPTRLLASNNRDMVKSDA